MNPNAQFYDALALIPKSKYAIPVSEIEVQFLAEPVRGDLVFVEVREYKKHTYMRKLFGSVGSFTRTKPALEDAKRFASILASDPLKYAKLFGEHYQRCAKCGAELTDQRSRELALGPQCRKEFGIK